MEIPAVPGAARLHLDLSLRIEEGAIRRIAPTVFIKPN
jgi:hypothetical protein